MGIPTKRPYLILSKLVEQQTWGGSYIAQFKNIEDGELKAKKIGQSYELYGKSLLSVATDTSDSFFQQDFIAYNKTGEIPSEEDCVQLEKIVGEDPKNTLGPAVKQTAMPLLIKFTQALGNSFQLHVRKKDESNRWTPKPESWYYLEDGIITFGVKKDADLAAYKQACLAIERKTRELSILVKDGKLSYKDAVSQLQNAIQGENPTKFVNVHRVKKHAIVDLSNGGIHHSWEEDPAAIPLGNIVYEVQLDVTDEDSTIRSFDKGKMQQNGDVREIHVEDYFKYLDTRPETNNLSLAVQKRTGSSLLSTPYYSMDLISVSKETIMENSTSFAHLFVIDGAVEIETADHTVEVGKGHSCFIPYGVKTYSLTPLQQSATILKTFIK